MSAAGEGPSHDPVDWWSGRSWLDVAVPLGLVIAHYVLDASDTWLSAPLASWPNEERAALYALVATITGIIVGFATAAMALYYSLGGGERLKYVRRRGGKLLSHSWIVVLRDPLLSVGLLLVAIVAEGPSTGQGVWWSQWLAEGTLFLIAARFARLTWIFSWVVRMIGDDESQPEEKRIYTGQVSVGGS